MIYPKTKKTKNINYKYKQFADFSSSINTSADPNILPLKYARTTYNFSTKDGALRDGLGINRLKFSEFTDSLPASVQALWFYRRFNFFTFTDDNMLVAFCSDGYLYYMRPASQKKEFIRIDNIVLSHVPVAVNYRLNSEDVLLICTDDEGMIVFNGENATLVPDAPAINSMVIHYERLFATGAGEGSTLWFSQDLDPTNWNIDLNEAGFITMIDERGKLLKVVSFLDYLFIFREYGITRLSAYGDQTQFSVSQLYVSSGEINPDTVSVCGDRIMFLASDGLYCFDGVSTFKVLPKIQGSIKNTETAVGCFFYGKYYLACNFDYGDGRKILCETDAFCNNTIIEYEISSGNLHLSRGMDIYCLCALPLNGKDKLLAGVRGEKSCYIGEIDSSAEYFGQPLPKLWESSFSDMGNPFTDKLIKAVALRNSKPTHITIRSENGLKTFTHPGSDGVAEIQCGVSGRLLSFCFESRTGGAYISHPLILLGS